MTRQIELLGDVRHLSGRLPGTSAVVGGVADRRRRPASHLWRLLGAWLAARAHRIPIVATRPGFVRELLRARHDCRRAPPRGDRQSHPRSIQRLAGPQPELHDRPPVSVKNRPEGKMADGSLSAPTLRAAEEFHLVDVRQQQPLVGLPGLAAIDGAQQDAFGRT